MKIRFLIPALGGLLIGLGLSQTMLPERALSQEAAAPAKKPEATKKAEAPKKPEVAKPAVKVEAAPKKPEAKPSEPEKSSPDLDALRATAQDFEKAFNAGDAKALAALFAEKAEVVDENGDLVQGRTDIEARFAELFKEFPKAKTTVEVTLLRQLSPDVAVEDGVSTVTLEPKGTASRSPYTLVHVKRDGKWLFASVRDYPEEPEAIEDTAHGHVSQLEWLVGHWVDESRDGRVETTCQWSEDGHYLLQEYTVKSRRGGELKGTQRIGWDPLRRTIRAWVFDNSGGIVESTWTPIDGAWMVKAEGTTADGEALSAIRILTSLSADSYVIDSTNQLLGGELLPDSTVRVVRRPPAPTK